MVKRALDSGAHGVMTAMCHTAADAVKIVSWNKYVPSQVHSRLRPYVSAHSFCVSDSKYSVDADANLLVIVQMSRRQCSKNAAPGSRTSVSVAWGRALENTIHIVGRSTCMKDMNGTF